MAMKDDKHLKNSLDPPGSSARDTAAVSTPRILPIPVMVVSSCFTYPMPHQLQLQQVAWPWSSSLPVWHRQISVIKVRSTDSARNHFCKHAIS